MNLALHGILLQVFVSILNFHHGRLLCSAGEPGYLDFDNLPETNFSCQGKVIGGYYADVEAGCQMFHVCTIGQKDEIMDIKFLCLNGTVFDQETRVCERVDEVDCSKSERFYNLNLELYGNNAVTFSLHENGEDEDDLGEPVEDHQPRTTSARPSTTSTTSSTTTSRPSKPSTTAASGSFQHPAGYPQHYQPQPPFPQVHTSQSKSLYDDKNGGYHRQYIFHNDERANDQATSYQLFSNQGAASSTTVSPTPQIHQVRYSSTVGPPPQIIHNEPSTVTPLFHATSSTIQTLLNSNANSPTALINPIFHNHGIASTTEQFTVHSNNPRETSDYNDEADHEQDVLPLEAIHQSNKGKVSKLTISPVPSHQESSRTVQKITSQTSQQQQKQQRLTSNFLPTPSTVETTVRSFYPTPKPSPKPSQSLSQSITRHVTQHVHVSRPVPQLKPHQITINLPPPDIQRIVQNPSPLLPSQSRVIVTAKASVSDESGRPLNTTQLVTLPLPTIPASYDDYKEGDESFDPFYRDVPKIRKSRRTAPRRLTGKTISRGKRSVDQSYRFVYGTNDQNGDAKVSSEQNNGKDNAMNEKNRRLEIAIGDFRTIKESLIKFRDILFSDEVDSFRDPAEKIANDTEHIEIAKPVEQARENAITKSDYLPDLKMDGSKHLDLHKNEDDEEDDEEEHDSSSSSAEANTEKSSSETREKSIKNTKSEHELELAVNTESANTHSEKKNHQRDDVIDVIILDSDDTFEAKPTTAKPNVEAPKTDAPIEIIIEDETRSGSSHDVSNEKITYNGQIVGYLTKSKSENQLSSVSNEEKQVRPQGTAKRKNTKDSRESKSGSRRKPSRSRSPRRRMSSRIKQQRTEYVEVTETTQRKEEDEDKTTTAASTTAASTTAASTAFVITTTPLSPPYEAKVAEQIDSHIFGEPESQTSKEIDTRAIGQRDAVYSKGLQNDKSHDNRENKEMERSFDHQIAKGYAKNLEEHADKPEEEKEQEEKETESTDYAQNTSPQDTNFTENPQSVEKETESLENTHVSEERKSSDELSSKETSNEEASDDKSTTEDTNDEIAEERKSSDELVFEETSSKEASDDGSTTENTNDEESEERKSFDELFFEETSSKEASDDGSTTENANDEETEERKSSDELSSKKTSNEEASDDESTERTNEKSEESSKQISNRNSSRDDNSRQEESDRVTSNVDNANEDESSTTTKYNEDTISAELDECQDTTASSVENTSDVQKDYKDSTTFADHTSSEEYTDSQENVSTFEETEASTEGILKFTDELPKLDSKDEDVETKEPEYRSKINVHDFYIDDNYEPQNYKETEKITTESYDFKEEKNEKKIEEKHNKEESKNATKDVDHKNVETHVETDVEAETQTEYVESITEVVDLKQTTEETNLTTTSSTTPTSTTSATLTTSTTTTTTTTSTTTTTTPRPTTTTPRATPPKLFKPTGSRRIYAYIPLTTTPNPVVIKPRAGLYNPKPAKPLKSYNELAPKPVIRKLSLSRKPATTTTTTTSSTTIATTESATTERLNAEIPETTMESVVTTIATITTTESGKSEENVLESKLEKNEPALLDSKNDQTEKEDQLPSSTEQKIPANSSRDAEPRISIEEIETTSTPREDVKTTFTPYPLSRLTTLISSVEQTTKEIEQQETTETTDVFVTTLPTTLPPEKSHIETSTDKHFEQAKTTPAPIEVQQNVTEIPSVTFVYPVTSIPISTTVQSKPENVDSVSTVTPTVFRPSNRKLASHPRKHASFNCLEKEMYRFYGDTRDCRLFHYCSPGFTARQVLDFRFVCEEGTAFDEETQSCRHDMPNRKCRNRSW